MIKTKSARKIIKLKTPIQSRDIKKIRIGDQIEIEGKIYCGRDAVLPKIVKLINNDKLTEIKVDLNGAVIFHTAVSDAGIGPTSSNKVEIEGSIPALSKAGVRIHLGKGSLSPNTIKELKKNNSVFAITPPVTALFSDKMISQRIVAFPKEGMEALWEVGVKSFPAIIAIAHGESIFSRGTKNAESKEDKRRR